MGIYGVGIATGLMMMFSGLVSASPPRLDEVFSKYVRIQESLAADSLKQALPAAKELAARTDELAKEKGASPALAKIRDATKTLAEAKTLESARESFKKVSAPVVELQRSAKDKSYEIAYCPMADAKWVQKAGKIRNPYYGSEMLECGEKSD